MLFSIIIFFRHFLSERSNIIVDASLSLFACAFDREYALIAWRALAPLLKIYL